MIYQVKVCLAYFWQGFRVIYPIFKLFLYLPLLRPSATRVSFFIKSPEYHRLIVSSYLINLINLNLTHENNHRLPLLRLLLALLVSLLLVPPLPLPLL